MKIKNQFIISIIIFIGVLVVISASIFFTNQQVLQLTAQEHLARNIQTGAADLSYLSNDYFLFRDSALLESWQVKYSSIWDDVLRINPVDPYQQTLAKNIKADLQGVNSAFNTGLALLNGLSDNESALTSSTFQLAWSRLGVQNQALAFEVSQLSQSLSAQVDQLQTVNITLIVILLSLFGAYFIINYLVTYRRTLKSISKLQDGLAVIGSGNLDYSLKSDKRDEIGEISKSVDQMATNLKTVTTSKLELEKEISERKKAQESLAKSEQRWATTLSSIGDAVIATDIAGKVTFMNNIAESLTGWTLKRAYQRPLQEVFHIINEETRQEVQSPVEKVLESGIIVGLANHSVLVIEDGTEVPIDDSASPIRDQNGQVTGVVLVFHDITERKQIEEAVRKSEEKYRSLFTNMIDGFAYCQMIFNDQGIPIDFVYLQINDAFENITGLKRDVVIGKKVSEAIPGIEKANPEILEIYGRVASTCQNEKFEIFFKPLSLWLSISVYCPIKGYFAAIFEDITERKKAEQELTQSLEREHLLAEVIRNASMGAGISYPDGKIGLINRAFENITGYSREELQTINWDTTLTAPEYLDLEKEKLSQLLNSKKPVRYEKEYIRKDGSRVPVELTVQPFTDSNGNVTHYFSFVIDITERKKTEQELDQYRMHLEKLVEERTKQLKDSERLAAIGATAGMVGHDIRNPLQAIVSDLYIARQEAEENSEGEAKQNMLETISAIEENVFYINKIVVDLQDFARPLNPRAQETNTKLVIEKSLASNGRIPDNIKTQVKVDADTELIVTDEDFLRRIMGNLVLNAVQAMPDGGKLTVRAFRDKQTNDTVLTVKDTGVGISEEVKPKLFTPMMTTKSKGQGFGLAVVKRMTEGLGGTISFKSQEGKGTIFTMRFPLKS